MSTKKDIKLLIESTLNYINNNDYLKNEFNHFNRKYTLDELLTNIIIIHTEKISYRKINKYTTINWLTIYNFYKKLIKFKVFEYIQHQLTNIYLTNNISNINKLYTDTSFINNQLGIESISYNPYNRKHKSTKISLIVDEFNIPIHVDIAKSVTHDSVILNNQLDKLKYEHPILFDNNKILIADAAYDSSVLRNKIKQIQLGKLLTPTNKRNNKKYINKLSLIDKLNLNTRYKVEHIIAKYKKFNRINYRYDKQLITFKNSLLIATLLLFINKTKLKINTNI